MVLYRSQSTVQPGQARVNILSPGYKADPIGEGPEGAGDTQVTVRQRAGKSGGAPSHERTGLSSVSLINREFTGKIANFRPRSSDFGRSGSYCWLDIKGLYSISLLFSEQGIFNSRTGYYLLLSGKEVRFTGNVDFVPVSVEARQSQFFEFVALGLTTIWRFDPEQSYCVAVATDAGLLP